MRTSQWVRAVDRYLLPRLSGRWAASGWVVHVQPVDWFVRAVVFSYGRTVFKATAIVQFLAVPKDHWVADLSLEMGGPGRFWRPPTTSEEAEHILADIATLIPAEATPFFDHHATYDGYLAYLDSRVRDLSEGVGFDGWEDVDEALTYLHLLRGDMAGAEQAAGWTERAGAAESRDWAMTASDRVRRTFSTAQADPDQGIAILKANTAHTCAALKLPRLRGPPGGARRWIPDRTDVLILVSGETARLVATVLAGHLHVSCCAGAGRHQPELAHHPCPCNDADPNGHSVIFCRTRVQD